MKGGEEGEGRCMKRVVDDGSGMFESCITLTFASGIKSGRGKVDVDIDEWEERNGVD